MMTTRRRFLAAGMAMAAWPQFARAHGRRVALATYSHIDVAWRWPLQEGLQQSDATFRSVLRVLDAFPELKFSATSASYYAWIRQTDPPTFSRIAAMVRQQRWEPIGGWWTEPDVNIVSGESLMRQAWYGQREFREHLGVTTQVAFLPDSFGSSANLAAILRAQGMRYYVMGRGSFANEAVPRGAFTWQSLGASSILVYNNPVSGGTNDAIETVTKAAELQDDLLVWFGLGDHGGGPTMASLTALDRFLATAQAPAVTFTAVEPYLNSIGTPALTQRGEIEGVFPGAYTNCYDMKRSAIDAERALLDCERFDVLAALCGSQLPIPQLDDLWETLLLNQHHDTISATGLQQNVAYAVEQNRAVADRATALGTFYLESIVDRIAHASEDESVLVVFNPLPHPLRAAIVYPLSVPTDRVPVIVDEAGNPVSVQITSNDPIFPSHNAPSIFAADLPAFGYTTYRINGSRNVAQAHEGTLATDIETSDLHVTLDAGSGLPAMLRDAVGALQLGRPRFAVFRDREDTWASDGLSTYPEFGSFDLRGLSVEERGEVRIVVRASHVFRSSRIDTSIEVRHGERAVRFTSDIDWNEPFMRLAFAFEFPGSDAYYDVPFGVVQRTASQTIQPGMSFVARPRSARGFVGLVTCGNHGFWASATTLGVSLVRSTPYSALDHVDYGVKSLQDTGRRRISFMVQLCDGLPELQRSAEAFERSFPVLWDGAHPGDLPSRASKAEIADNVTLSSLRRTPDSTQARLHSLIDAQVRAAGRIGTAAFETAVDAYGIRTLELRGENVVDVSPP